MGDRCNRTINSVGPSVPRALHGSKNQQKNISEPGPHALRPDTPMAGSMQLKIGVLTFFPYQSLKVNTKLLIRTKHKEQVERLLTERSVLHQQLRSALPGSTRALVSKRHPQKKKKKRLQKTTFTLAFMLQIPSRISFCS